MDEVKKIIQDIKNRHFSPIYFLMGEEPYYIDLISKYLENNVLSTSERDFNQMMLYGRDTDISSITEYARRYPMMAEYQVIIIKEAQDLSRHIEKLTAYASAPQATSILVLNYKYKKIDKRKALYKALKKTSLVFESKKLYENQVVDWIQRLLRSKGYGIMPKAAQMLVEFLGTDLSKINNELEKLQIILPKGSEITPETIEVNIGFSKDFNNFELRKAIGSRNKEKAFQIIHYFSENPREHPIVVTIALLFNFFSQLLLLHGLADKSPRHIASVLRVNPYFVSDYTTAAKNYPMRQVSAVITILREFDLKSKGVGANALPQSELLKELLIKIL